MYSLYGMDKENQLYSIIIARYIANDLVPEEENMERILKLAFCDFVI